MRNAILPAILVRRRARRIGIVVCFYFAMALPGCESLSYKPPPVTAGWSQTATRQHVDLATLRQGRVLFASRCIECHTLPVAGRYKDSDWPCIVREMAIRADLKPAERDAVLAYILAAQKH